MAPDAVGDTDDGLAPGFIWAAPPARIVHPGARTRRLWLRIATPVDPVAVITGPLPSGPVND
jgi:hypothetical protein